MKKAGRRNLTLAKETLRNLEGDDLQNVNGGIAPAVILTVRIAIVVVGATLLAGDTPQ